MPLNKGNSDIRTKALIRYVYTFDMLKKSITFFMAIMLLNLFVEPTYAKISSDTNNYFEIERTETEKPFEISVNITKDTPETLEIGFKFYIPSWVNDSLELERISNNVLFKFEDKNGNLKIKSIVMNGLESILTFTQAGNALYKFLPKNTLKVGDIHYGLISYTKLSSEPLELYIKFGTSSTTIYLHKNVGWNLTYDNYNILELTPAALAEKFKTGSSYWSYITGAGVVYSTFYLTGTIGVGVMRTDTNKTSIWQGDRSDGNTTGFCWSWANRLVCYDLIKNINESRLGAQLTSRPAQVWDTNSIMFWHNQNESYTWYPALDGVDIAYANSWFISNPATGITGFASTSGTVDEIFFILWDVNTPTTGTWKSAYANHGTSDNRFYVSFWDNTYADEDYNFNGSYLWVSRQFQHYGANPTIADVKTMDWIYNSPVFSNSNITGNWERVSGEFIVGCPSNGLWSVSGLNFNTTDAMILVGNNYTTTSNCASNFTTGNIYVYNTTTNTTPTTNDLYFQATNQNGGWQITNASSSGCSLNDYLGVECNISQIWGDNVAGSLVG